MSKDFPIICKECGKEELGKYREEYRQELLRRVMCFNCSFWQEKIEWREAQDPRAVVTSEHKHFHIGDEDARGFRGFGGNNFTVRFHDGRVVKTTNLWHQGTIPDRFRDRLTPNAEID